MGQDARVNYRHAFHAGNHADVLKHVVLLACLQALARKETPFTVLDVHAGAGLYDLESEAARRSPEWRDGVGRLAGWADAPALARAYLDAVAPFAPRLPGSPLLALSRLRADDRLILNELHPEEAEALRRAVGRDPRVSLHRRDAYEALGALLPLRERRGLVLIDPPYEQPGEMARAGLALREALRRFRQGMFLWWRPLKAPAEAVAADAEIAAAHHPLKALRVSLRVRADGPGGLAASGLLLINPPHGLDEALRALLPALSERLGQDDAAGWSLDALGRL